MSETFNPQWFDEEFYRRTTGDKGAKRDQNSPNYIEYASKVKRAFSGTGAKTLLDIGSGMGFRTLNHIQNRFWALGCDISQWAFENSVLPKGKHIRLDMRDLGTLGRQFDIVNVERSIEYLPKEDLLSTLKTIDSVAKRFIIFSILISDHSDQGLVQMGSKARLSMMPRWDWNNLFSQFPHWTYDVNKTKIMLLNKWDGIWVFDKTEK